MSAYMIFSFDIVDAKGFAPYGAMAIPTLKKYGAEVLAAGFPGEELEGNARGANVIVRFPSTESAKAFYDDPEYVAARDLRIATTGDRHMVLVEEFRHKSSDVQD